METELKLLVSPQDAAALQQHPLLKKYAAAKPYELTMSDTYFDTPDLHIRRCDAGLRVRQVDHNEWVQTLKGGGSINGGLHSRNEWESRVAGPKPDLAALRDVVDHKTAWGRLLRSPVIEDRLLPIFTTQVKRMVWELRLPQGDQVECVLDQGDLERNDQKVPISEVELELKAGDPTHLFDFALTLQREIPLQIGNLSKADRGYAMLAPQPPAAVKAPRLKLSKRMKVEQAFQAIAANCMAQIQANEAGVVEVPDTESLHQMRVGLRRLRSVLGLFKEVLQPPEELQQDLDWLAAQLGPARDWDVLAESTLPAIAKAVPDQARFAEVERATQDKAHEKHDTASAAIRSPRYARLILSFSRWLQGRGWREAMPPQQQKRLSARLIKFAHSTLVHDQRRLLKRGRKLRRKRVTPELRHRLRIAAKKTRYAAEFFQSLYATKRVRPYVAALSALQDELGWLNDAAVADQLLQQLQDEQTELDVSTGFIRGYLASRIESDDRKIRKLWKKFTSMKVPC